ncbi:M28 family peptidase [Salinimicrobium catena]|nr:M28 family peptidase [Salinimicrobium catena]
MRKIPFFSAIALFLMLLISCGDAKGVIENSIDSEEGSSEEVPNENVISQDDVAQTLKYLSSDELQGRKTGSEGIEKAAVYIENIFEDAGIKPFFETYRNSFEENGVTGYNIVGLKEGTDPLLKDEVIIVGAHYDHVGKIDPVGGDELANGANDNASGTTAVLELAKYFSRIDTKRSILFTLFSAEELGLVGSDKLASTLKDEELQPYVMFNIEMIGVPMTDKDYLVYLTGFDRSNMAEIFNDYSEYPVVGYLPKAAEFQLFKRSDNYPFFEQFNIPAHTVSSFDFSNYDYYHHVNDEFEELDVEHMDRMIEALVPGLREMANSEENHIKLNQ